MSGIDVQKLSAAYTTNVAAQQALNKGEITKDEYNALVLFKNQTKDANFYDAKGTTVESANDKALTPEQQETKKQAKQAELDEIAQAKEAAKAKVQNEGVETEYGKVTSYRVTIKDESTGKETTTTAFTFDIKAPTRKREKSSRGEQQDRMARYYDEKSGEWIELQEGESMKDLKKRLRAKEKELKSEKKAAKKQLKADRKDSSVSLDELREDNLKLAEAREEYNQVKEARKAAQGKGIKSVTSARNKNVKANNRLVNREVFYNETEAKAAKKSPEFEGKTIRVASKDDTAVLRQLSATAQDKLKVSSSIEDRAIWRELANLFKDENGNDIEYPDTKKVQDALIDLTGGDMRLNYSEQKTISIEIGMSMSDVRSAFRTYGFEAPHPIGKRITNGLVAAVPVAAAVGLEQLLLRNRVHAKAEATAEAKATATAHVEGSVTAETPGYSYDWVDPITGEGIHHREKGQSVTEYYNATDTATAYATETAVAVIDKLVGLSPAGLIAAPAAAFIAGFAARPVEISAAQNGVNTQKMASFVKVYKGGGNRRIGNQIVQMAGQITGDKALDRAIIVAVLDHDIGSQNFNPRERELENALSHLEAIKEEVKKFRNLPPKPEKPAQETPTPAPTACPVDLYSTPTEYIHRRKAGDTWAGLVKAYYPDCLTGDSKHTMTECIRELKKQLAFDNDGNFHQDIYTSLLKGHDLPKELKMPEKIFDCEIHKDGKVKTEQIVHSNNRGKVLDKAGRTYYHATQQSCKDNEPTNAPEGTVVKTGGKTFKVENGQWKEQK